MIRNTKAQAFHIVIIILSVFVLCGAYNKATGKDELIFISTEREKAIGDSVAKQVNKEYKETDDPLHQKRVEEIGFRLAKVSDRKDLQYRFKVLKSKEDDENDNYNAFALPGGYVYIFDDFVKALKTDDQIAAVLAHEIGHIAARDSIKRLQSGIGMNALMLLAVGAGASGKDMQEANYAVGQLMMSYSREAEVQADKLSVKYLKLAKYDPNAVLDVIKFMREYSKKSPIRSFIYYRSHPYLSERYARAKTEVNDGMDFDSYINLPKNKDDY